VYQLRTEWNVAPGGNEEVEAFAAKLGELRKKAPGGLSQTLLRSYGRPGVYTLMGRYESAEAAWAFGNSKAFKDLVKSLPAGLMTPSGPQRAYVNVLEVDAEGLANPEDFTCEVLIDWTVDFAKRRDFEESRRELFELRKKHEKGFGSNRLRSNAGTPTEYLVLMIAKDYDSLSAPPPKEVVAFASSHGSALYGSVVPSIEVFHVVHRM
jgi:quinol monooxygenase YgiN